MKKILFIVLGASLLLGLIFLIKDKSRGEINPNKVSVVASFYPIYFFAKQVGGDKVDVYNVTPAGAEPHDYEPTTDDLRRIENSKILFINGSGLEPWGDKIPDLVRTRNVKVVAVADGLINLQVEEEGGKIPDPHVWLDPVLAKKEVEKITNGLVSIDPDNKNYYISNSTKLLSDLDKLNNDFKRGLSRCSEQNIVTSHAAFGYLAREYGLKQLAISGLSPDEEPTPKQIADVANFAKKNNVKYIFFETLVSPKLSETVAKEIGAQTIVFNPLEGLTDQEIKDGKDYFLLQRQNLANLRVALNCK